MGTWVWLVFASPVIGRLKSSHSDSGYSFLKESSVLKGSIDHLSLKGGHIITKSRDQQIVVSLVLDKLESSNLDSTCMSWKEINMTVPQVLFASSLDGFVTLASLSINSRYSFWRQIHWSFVHGCQWLYYFVVTWLWKMFLSPAMDALWSSNLNIYASLG